MNKYFNIHLKMMLKIIRKKNKILRVKQDIRRKNMLNNTFIQKITEIKRNNNSELQKKKIIISRKKFKIFKSELDKFKWKTVDLKNIPIKKNFRYNNSINNSWKKLLSFPKKFKIVLLKLIKNKILWLGKLPFFRNSFLMVMKSRDFQARRKKRFLTTT